MKIWNAEANDLFLQALELQEGPARQAFLERACGRDAELRRRVEGLLAAGEQAGSFLASPALDFGEIPTATAPEADPVDAAGATVGSYKLLEKIGEGGFGSVYVAEQREPVQRRVALKVIKLGMDSKQVIARFEAERQALAMMDHPNIARVLDAGATDAQSVLGPGRPFFAMELVRGIPITTFCDEDKLSIRRRLGLFIDVCHAVQHAHHKGVVHRDIKPTNVLVTMHDDKPVPKVIDFGLAKATHGRLTDKTVYTGFRQLIGTPAYMSPEQAQMSGTDIDTRSDIYSLGVLLYELLTGATPFDKRTLLGAGFDEMCKMVREVEPPTPSTSVAAMAEARRRNGAAHPGDAAPAQRDSAEIARRRATDPRALRSELHGDLDWVTMKCLEKDRARRYETANALAADVQHYLNGEPVLAAPPSATYRLMKFARRHRSGVLTATLVALALVLGLLGTGSGLVRAEAALEREQEQRELAEKREAETRQVAEFQAAMLSEIDVEAMGVGIKQHFREQVRASLERQYVGEFPDHRKRTQAEVDAELAAFDQRAGAAHATDVARRVMDTFVLARAADALETEFADQPLVRAQLHEAVGITYGELALYREAEPHLRAALEIRQRELSDEHSDTLSSLHDLGWLLHLQGKLAEAEQCYRKALEGLRHVQGDDHPDTLIAFESLGWLLHEQGKQAEAEPYYREALEGLRRVRGDDDPDTLMAIGSLGSLWQDQRRLAEAEPYTREALEGLRRVRGDDHPATLRALNNMGVLVKAQGKLAEAEPYYREALQGNRRVLGDDHPNTLTSISNMSTLLQDQGNLAEAEQYGRVALEGRRRVLGDDHQDTLRSIHNMGSLLNAQGKLAEAEPYYREALEGGRRVLGDEHPQTFEAINSMGSLLQNQGNLAEAEPYVREALEGSRRVLGDDDPITLQAINNMGAWLRNQGKPAEAEPYYREALEVRRRVLGDDHPDTLDSISNMAAWLSAQGKPAEAEPYCRELLERQRRVLGDDHPDTLMSIYNVGFLLEAQGKRAEAEQYYREAAPILQRLSKVDDPRMVAVLENSARALRYLNRPSAALPEYEAALTLCQRLFSGDHPDVARNLSELGDLLRSLERPTDALPKYEAALGMRQRLYPGDHRDVAKSLDQLARCLCLLDRPTDALPKYEAALAMRQRLYRGDHRDVATSLDQLARCLCLLDRPDEALLKHEAALAMWKRLPDSDTYIADSLSSLGLLHLQQGKYAQAESIVLECLAIREKALQPDSKGYWTLANARSLLGGALAGQGAALIESDAPAAIARFSEAEALLVESGTWLIQNQNRINPEFRRVRSREALERIVTLYEAWDTAAPESGKAEQAALWRAELEKLDGR
jgi:serine/threonine protein kinase/tetratricopeptide (TPR) repeat protein